MKLIKKIRSLMLAAVPAAVMMCSPTDAGAAKVKAELMLGQKAATLDMKISGEVAQDIGFYARSTTTVGYDGKASQFLLGELSCNVVDKLYVASGAQVSGGKVIPYVGLEYFVKKGDVSATVATVMTLEDKPSGSLIADVTYSPKLSEELKLFARFEDLSSFVKEGHAFTRGKLRLGLDIKGYIVGAAADLTLSGMEPKFDYSIGGFLAKEF